MAMQGETSGEGAAPGITAKLFVGQVPNQFSEEDLKKVFAPYGEVTDAHILTDRVTGTSKGCGFITFNNRVSADKAIEGLHGKVTLHQTKRPMVVRYSGVPASEDQSEAKLFVGMMARETTDADIRKLFQPFGNIIEVYVMKDNEGNSKGCAFVRFSNRDSANQAILALDQKHIDQGQQRPIQVKYAHNKTDKDKQKAQQGFQSNPYALQMAMMGGALGGLGRGGAAMFNPNLLQQNLSQAGYGMAGAGGGMGGPAQAGGGVGYGFGGYGAQPDPTNPYGASQTPNPYTSMGYGGGPAAPMQNQGGVGGARGPPGANVFVYNVPENFSDLDLSSMFGNFGTVVSASIFRDKITGVSKGFGFVSYTDAASAAKGIEALNGFHIGNKRLKVQLKKGEPGASSQPKGYAPY